LQALASEGGNPNEIEIDIGNIKASTPNRSRKSEDVLKTVVEVIVVF